MAQKLCIIGLGYIGSEVIKNLDQFRNKIELSAVFDIEKKKMEEFAKKYPEVRQMTSITDFDDCDVVVEAAIQQVVVDIFDKIVELKKIFIPMSIGAFITNQALYQKYTSLEKPVKLLIKLPSGAIGGFDAINSMMNIGIESAKLTTSKPLDIFRNQTYVKEQQIDLKENERTLVFQGNAKEAAELFPRSINIGARLALATMGPIKTQVEIFSDPKINKNTHEIAITSEVGEYKFSFQNNPSPSNPKTSWLAALSILEILEKIE